MKLTQKEQLELTKLENIIKTKFYDVGKALFLIKENKLYRESGYSFEIFCQKEYEFSSRKADYLINAYKIVDNFKSYNQSTKDPLEKITVFPKAESQIRNLASFPIDIQIKLWKRAVQLNQGKVPTAKIVNSVIDLFRRTDKELSPEIEKILPKIKLAIVKKPYYGQKVRVNSKNLSFAGKEGIITQVPNRDSALVKLEGTDKRELIKIENLETQTIIFPETENKPNALGIKIEYKAGYACQHYLHVSEEVCERIKQYATQIHNTVNGVISLLLSNANLQYLTTV